eukprot:TRINITY_DN21735_c0_g1_i1.p1 TRINITY_DN21735_c0_g1~~TRINITY_DN21735_c0_g1_i1.p1  ORF type:complete len:268 (+),score=29.36 TRINITY_DN21735_c0_g1_i1:37-840(+)
MGLDASKEIFLDSSLEIASTGERSHDELEESFDRLNLLDLPVDVFLAILNFLPRSSLANLARVSSRLKSFIDSDRHWENRYKRVTKSQLEPSGISWKQHYRDTVHALWYETGDFRIRGRTIARRNVSPAMKSTFLKGPGVQTGTHEFRIRFNGPCQVFIMGFTSEMTPTVPFNTFNSISYKSNGTFYYTGRPDLSSYLRRGYVEDRSYGEQGDIVTAIIDTDDCYVTFLRNGKMMKRDKYQWYTSQRPLYFGVSFSSAYLSFSVTLL